MLLQHQPQYTKWTTAELRSFIQTRTCGEVEAPNRRYACIDTLRRLDEEPKFERFPELAAELRIEIYKYTLTHDRELGSIAYPEILRVSKQVHHEASDVMYAESRLVLRGIFYSEYYLSSTGYETEPAAIVRQLPRPRTTSHAPELRIHKCLPPSVSLDAWMEGIKVVRNLHLQLPLNALQNRFAKIFLAHVVLRCNDLHKLTIECFGHRSDSELTPGGYVYNLRMVDALLPLKGLAEKCTLSLHGLAEIIEGDLRKDIARVVG